MADQMDLGAILDGATLDELEELEKRAGVPIDRLLDADTPKVPVIRGVALLIRRRTDPAATPEDVGSMTMGEMSALLGGDEGEGPTLASVSGD